ncbi:MAG: glycerol kinase GlpK [Planctomycetales bacterium]|nr:glycerol kinase GlpK [Planctomycetales bacterium]
MLKIPSARKFSNFHYAFPRKTAKTPPGSSRSKHVNILSIDQSTSATKAIVFNERGELLAKASRSHEQIYPQPGWVEHNAEEIWSNTLAVIEEVARRHPELVDQIACLSITNQRETTLVFDRDSGQPIGNAIVWQCRRGTELCEQLADAGHGDYVSEATGLKLDPYFSASKLKWIIDNKPHIAARLQDGTALIATIDTYLIYRLTNGKVFATDSTNACRTLLYNIHDMDWDPKLCELFSVPRQSLPKVRDASAEFGTTDAEGKLPRSIPICGVMGDSQASLFALGCHNVGDAKVTIGTGSSLLLNVGNDVPQLREGTVATVAWSLNDEPTYCIEGIINYSAATIEWLKNQLGLIANASETAELATSVPDNGGVYLVPAFAGLSAPYWDPNARAAILGMTAHSSKAHVVRAALESIAYQIRDAFDMMQKETGVTPTKIHADGGGTSNEFLMQFIADMLQIPLHVSGVAESSPLGAAMAGALGQGMLENTQAVSNISSVAKSYRPQMERAVAQTLYTGWQDAVKRVL